MKEIKYNWTTTTLTLLKPVEGFGDIKTQFNVLHPDVFDTYL